LAPNTPHGAPKQASLIDLLRTGPLKLDKARALGFQRSVINALIEKDLVETCEIVQPEPWQTKTAPLPANPEQQSAIDSVRSSLNHFQVHLLYGITGSGKTEVYLQTIATCLNQGRQALVLLPEIALTPQTLARFEARFEAPVVALHSGIGDAARDRAWAAARHGHAAIILGTRSTVFVPMNRLGLIVVDEEHDAAFIQQDGLRYSARDVAIKRAQLEGCNILLGSATPSLESWHNAEKQRYQRHVLSQRAGNSQLPEQRLIDISGLELSAGLSAELISHIEQTLINGEQVLVFLNRRGFANALLCHDCGWSSDCPDCDARMTLHKIPPALHCHHCDRRNPLPSHCPACSSRRLVGTGVGTQQTETFLAERFATYPVVRVDSDTVTSKAAIPELIDQLASADPILMIGTQMLSKGHHFPHVTLVAVVDADALLFSPDFRGEERLLQLLTQVAGRAGRDRKPGQVIIQTRQPEHPLIRGLDAPYHSLLPDLLRQRAQARLPPYGALAVIRCDSHSKQEGLDFLRALKEGTPAIEAHYIGPLPAAMARRKNRYRSQLIITAKTRPALAHTVAALVSQAELGSRPHQFSWSVDIDPYEAL
jgi:primosomal protein N' (replication factor Y)